MNAAAHGVEGNANAAVLYMALELSNTTWKVVFGDGVRRRQVAASAGELVKLQQAVAEAKKRFGLASSTRVLSCYEAGRDGRWLIVDHHLIIVSFAAFASIAVRL